jgi:uncharacterized protein
MISSELRSKTNLINKIFKNKIVVVAYSGGVDSAVLGKLAQLHARKAFLVTGDSLTVPPGELDDAKKVAAEIGLPHLVIKTDEMANKNFIKNPTDRCYYCKSELSKVLKKAAEEKNADLIVEGTNYSDISGNDHRPGHRAVNERGIRSPLAEVKITKAEIRQLAREWNLSIADKPSMACLSSRFPYGDEITDEKLIRVGEAECFLKDNFGISVLRVRDHNGVARIEVAPDERAIFFDTHIMDTIYKKFKSLGFNYVSLDLKGFRSGAMNEVLNRN